MSILKRLREHYAPTRLHNGQPSWAECFALHEAEIRAVANPRAVNVSVIHLGRVIRRAVPKLAKLRAKLARLEDLNLAQIDALLSLLSALEHTNTDSISHVTTNAQHHELRAEAITLRRRMRKEKESLTLSGDRPVVHLTPLRDDAGYDDLASDLMSLTRFFQHKQDRGERCSFSQEDLDDAELMAEFLTRVQSWRRDNKDQLAELAHVRRQAFTLVVEAYDEARAAVLFLRRKEKDGDTITPPLGRVPTKRKRKQAEPEDGGAPPDAPDWQYP